MAGAAWTEGRASPVTFFLHRFIVFHPRDDVAEPLAFAIALVLPLAGFVMLSLHGAPPVLRRIFLGESPRRHGRGTA